MKLEYFIYALTLRFIIFDYYLLEPFRIWFNHNILENLRTSKSENKIILLNRKKDWRTVIVNDVIRKIGNCSLCNGTWAGYFIYLMFVFNWEILPYKEILELGLFGYSCGLLSYIIKELVFENNSL